MELYGKEIQQIIGDVKSLVENVSSNAKIITEVSEHSYASSEEITAIMSEITKGASDQAISTNEGMDYMIDKIINGKYFICFRRNRCNTRTN